MDLPATDKQHGQAGFADASPKFCSAALRKISAVPGNVVQHGLAGSKTGGAGKTAYEEERKNMNRPMNYARATLENDYRISLQYMYPENIDKQLPVMIFCSGWKGSMPPKETMLDSYEKDLDIVYVTFDYFATGASAGSWEDMTYGKWARSIKHVYDYIRTLPIVDPKRIGLRGESSGTTAAFRFAIEYENPAFIISTATAIGLYIGMPNPPPKKYVEAIMSNQNPEYITVMKSDRMKRAFCEDFILNAPIYNLPKVKCPVFFLQGGADNISRRTDAWAGYQILKNNGNVVKYLELEGGNHGVSNIEGKMDYVYDWVRSIGIL